MYIYIYMCALFKAVLMPLRYIYVYIYILARIHLCISTHWAHMHAFKYSPCYIYISSLAL